MTEEEFDRLTLDAKQVMLFVKCSDDADQLEEVIKRDEFRKVKRSTVRMINAVTDSGIPLEIL